MPNVVEQTNGSSNQKRNNEMHKIDDQIMRINVEHLRTCPVDERGRDAEGGSGHDG